MLDWLESLEADRRAKEYRQEREIAILLAQMELFSALNRTPVKPGRHKKRRFRRG